MVSEAAQVRADTAGPARRPAVVTVAAGLLLVMALAGILHAVYAVASLAGIAQRFRTAAAGATDSDIDLVVAAARAGVLTTAGLGTVVAVLLALLAFGIWRGSTGARVATWVVSGLGLLCGCLSLGAVLIQRSVPVEVDPAAADLIEALVSAYPSGWVALSGILSAAQTLGYLVVAVLLALPPAGSFFRRHRPASRRPQTPFPAPYAPRL
jgi:hypothetical protein